MSQLFSGQDTQKEIIFGSSDPNVSRVLSKKEKDGELRKVAPRIYTTNLIDSLENIVRRNLMDILVYRYPDALISHRSAKEMRPTATGVFFLTGSTSRRVTEIAYRLGYEDYPYFSRLFRKQTGMSPRAFRQKYLE